MRCKCFARGCELMTEMVSVFCPYHLASLPDGVAAAIRRVVDRYGAPGCLTTGEFRVAVSEGVRLIMEAERGVEPAAVRAAARAAADQAGPVRPAPPRRSPVAILLPQPTVPAAPPAAPPATPVSAGSEAAAELPPAELLPGPVSRRGR